MLARLRSRAQEEKGFTLIELLVVVLIIGILAAIAIPAFLGQKKGAQDANAKSLLRNSAIALESYYSDNQSFDASTSASPGATPILATDLTNIEPNIGFGVSASAPATSAATATILSKDNKVVVRATKAGSTYDGYILYTRSASGNLFTYVRDASAKTYKCKADGTVTTPAWDEATTGSSPNFTCVGGKNLW